MKDLFKRTGFIKSYLVIIVILISVLGNDLIAQNRNVDFEQRLINLEDRIPGLSDTIGISVENLSLQSFLVAVMKETDVNLSISTSIKHQITNNFSKVSIRDLVLFLCKEYNLDFSVTGNILTLREISSDRKPMSNIYNFFLTTNCLILSKINFSWE